MENQDSHPEMETRAGSETQLKECTKCLQSKPLSDFQKDPRYRFGVKSRCRRCISDYGLELYYRDHERNVAYQREHYARNPEHQREAARAWKKRSGYRPKITYKPEKFRGNPHHAARTAVSREVKKGAIPRISTQRCLDCGGQAQQYDHFLGHEKEHWLDIQPVCIRCHKVREAKRGAIFMYGVTPSRLT